MSSNTQFMLFTCFTYESDAGPRLAQKLLLAGFRGHMLVVTEYDADTVIFHLMNLCRCRNLSAAVYSSDNDFLLVSSMINACLCMATLEDMP